MITMEEEEETSGSGGSPPNVPNVDNVDEEEQVTRSGAATQAEYKNARLFHHMAIFPWPYLIIIPIAFAFLIGFGWSKDDIVEEEVANIWIATGGDYAQSKEYMRDLGLEDDLAASSFAAMAIARDGGNLFNATHLDDGGDILFNATRLQEIRHRMEKTENTTIKYKGITFTWDDICYSNPLPYKFPCARLSPMDLFQEARWFFREDDKVTWYQDIVKDLLVKPRIPRFGVMTQTCPGEQECATVLALRLNKTFAVEQGYPPEYANPLGLFADIGNMELNDPCRRCIEDNYKLQIDGLYASIPRAFGALTLGLGNYSATLTDPDDIAAVNDLYMKTAALWQTISINDVEEFYRYYVTRGLYAELGAAAYLDGYNQAKPLLSQCPSNLTCPPLDISATVAKAALLNHADNEFSSVTTAGAPFPWWKSGDGTGALFAGSEPVSGSGVNMSGNITTIVVYALGVVGATGIANTTDPLWAALVESNPIYTWFMASLTPADHVCGNGLLTGTNTSNATLDAMTRIGMGAKSQFWCTKYNVPNADSTGDNEAVYTQQHFARMWYDLLIDSPAFLGIVQGVDDPYTWTTGQGCGYILAGERRPYYNTSTEDILSNASRELYYIDEGESIGVVDRNLLMGGVTPAIGEYNFENPLKEVKVVQTLYAALLPPAIVERVANCDRPNGPVEITEADAEEILEMYKEAMENSWTEGWDDDTAGEVQFVAFFDDGGGVVGTTGRLLRDITLDNTNLMVISIILIGVFSVLFLCNFDLIESRILLTIIGVGLVVLAFFAALGFALLIGTKINVTIAWTLPFIILGLGVDDMYIVLMSLKKQGGFSEHHFLRGMKDVIVPVTMTSLVNASMFATMNINDIPAVYLTAQVAIYCVIALYLAVVFCFPAYCYRDMKRQADGRYDVFFCWKREEPPRQGKTEDFRSTWLYQKWYRPIVLGTREFRFMTHTIIWLAALTLFGIGVWGITERTVGLGLEDFFPSDHQASKWATVRTEELASWSIGMNWGAINYTDPDTQMKMIKQFEDVVATPHVAEIDTKHLWLADFLIWTTRQCSDNFDRESFDVLECGPDQNCVGKWVENKYSLREKIFASPAVCQPYEGGICRPGSQMQPEDLEAIRNETGVTPLNDTVFCPVIDDWSDEKWQFCLVQWRNITDFSGGRFVLNEKHGSDTSCSGVYNQDETFQWPIPYTAGPTMFAYDLFSHELTLEMMDQTRNVCDDDEELDCWMQGIPFDYWTQYEGIDSVLVDIAGWATLVGFAIAFIFLFAKLMVEKQHSCKNIFWGSLIGALLIVLTIILSLVCVVGLSVLADVSLTGFSTMAFVLSVGFAVEYSVHIVARWLRCDMSKRTSLERVEYTMSFLMLPTFMAFASSTIGVVCLAFTQFEFNRVFFFRPLIIVMFVTYFFGCWWLPALLTLLDFDVVKLGKPAVHESIYMTASLDNQNLDKMAEGLSGKQTIEDVAKHLEEEDSSDEIVKPTEEAEYGGADAEDGASEEPQVEQTSVQEESQMKSTEEDV